MTTVPPPGGKDSSAHGRPAPCPGSQPQARLDQDSLQVGNTQVMEKLDSNSQQPNLSILRITIPINEMGDMEVLLVLDGQVQSCPPPLVLLCCPGS